MDDTGSDTRVVLELTTIVATLYRIGTLGARNCVGGGHSDSREKSKYERCTHTSSCVHSLVFRWTESETVRWLEVGRTEAILYLSVSFLSADITAAKTSIYRLHRRRISLLKDYNKTLGSRLCYPVLAMLLKLDFQNSV